MPPKRRLPRSMEQTSWWHLKDQRRRLLVKNKGPDPWPNLKDRVELLSRPLIHFNDFAPRYNVAIISETSIASFMSSSPSQKFCHALLYEGHPSKCHVKENSSTSEPATVCDVLLTQLIAEIFGHMLADVSFDIFSDVRSCRRSSKVTTFLLAWVLATSRGWSKRCTENCVRRRTTKITPLSTCRPCRINFVKLLLTLWWNI